MFFYNIRILHFDQWKLHIFLIVDNVDNDKSDNILASIRAGIFYCTQADVQGINLIIGLFINIQWNECVCIKTYWWVIVREGNWKILNQYRLFECIDQIFFDAHIICHLWGFIKIKLFALGKGHKSLLLTILSTHYEFNQQRSLNV